MDGNSLNCGCKRCELLRQIRYAREDLTLWDGERGVLIADLRADLANAPVCPNLFDPRISQSYHKVKK